MSKKIISIIIPTYNSQKTIINTLKSLQQTFKTNLTELEIIISDDGSGDDTLNYIRQFEQQYQMSFRILQNSHQGVSFARNQGILNATGKYLLFVDSDDLLLNHLNLDFITEMDSHPDVIYLTLNHNQNAQTNSGKTALLREFVGLGSNNLGPTIFSKFYRRQFLLDNNLIFDTNLRVGEDLIFNLNCANLAESFKYHQIKEPIYQYITSSSAHLYKEENLSNELLFRKKILEICNQTEHPDLIDIKDKLGITGLIFLIECYFAPLYRQKK